MLLIIFSVAVIFQSCYEEETNNCFEMDVNLKSVTEEKVSIGSAKEIPVEITNNCENEFKIWEIKLKGDNKNEFYIKGDYNNSIISKNGLTFNLVFQPKEAGTKKITLDIRHDFGTSVLNFTVNVD